MKIGYTKIDNIRDYLEELKSDENFSAATYEKYKKVHARKGIPGEKIVTVLSDGTVETENTVCADLDGNVDWVVKNPSGEEYVVKHSVFIKKYAPVENTEDLFAPVGAPIVACRTPKSISFTAPWGEEMNIVKGGYLVISNMDDIYGIQEKEFLETYRAVDKN